MGQDQHPLDRALTLLAACPELTRDELAALSVGQRGGLARLLTLRERTFGPALSLDDYLKQRNGGRR